MPSYDAVSRAVSAAYVPPDTVLSLRAGPGSTEPIEFINYETDYSDEAAGELVVHVRGEAEDLDEAPTRLLNAAVRNLSIISLAANAAILTPHLQVGYEARAGGRFKAVRTLGADPQAAHRVIDIEPTGRLIQAFDRHPKTDRLLRAAENYAESLRRIQPVSSIHALMHLWIAVENLTRVIVERLKREQGGATLSELGLALEVKPRSGKAAFDHRDINSEIRRRYVFGGHDDVHRALREASDGVEHGYLSFGEARELAEKVFDRAAQLIRQSILRESGILDASVHTLVSGIYARPLPLWRAQVIAEGTIAADARFNFGERPIHLRPEAKMRIESITRGEHATTVAVDTQLRALDGLEYRVERIGVAVPGEGRMADDPG